MRFNYGTLEVDTASFHPVSLDAMVRRGVAHFLGNEMASKVIGWEETENKARKESGLDPVSDEEKAAKKLAFQQDGIAALAAGTVGATTRGPRVDPLTAALQAIAKKEVEGILRANGLKVPKGDEMVTFADGKQKTMALMIETRLNLPSEKDRIAKEAAKKVADDERKAKKAKEDAAKRGNATPASADVLGL